MKRLLLVAFLWGVGGVVRSAEPFDVAVTGPQPTDALILQGDYTAPTSSSTPVLVLAHGLGSTRGEWAPLLQRAAKRGWGALAYDLRGHGRSRGTMAGRTVNYEDPQNGRSPAFWQNFPDDLEKVVAALEKKTGTARNRIVLVGASLGANTALNAAARLPGIRGVVLLSPGLDYAGLLTEGPMAALSTPALMIAAKPDLYAYTSCERLKSLVPTDTLAWKPLSHGTPQGAHGVQLFDGQLEDRILDWVAGTAKR